MEIAIIISALIGLLVGAAIGGLVLHLLAKFVAKIEDSSFGKGFKIALISSIVIFAVWWVLDPETLLSWGVAGVIVFNVVLNSIVYIFVGQKIWKCDLATSAKANAIWILLYAGSSAWLLGQM